MEQRQAPRVLRETQERLSSLVTEPSGEAAFLDAGLAAWVRGDRGLAAAERVAVYANAYFARIHECLREDFGALARALGSDAFHDLAKTYLMLHPSRQRSLRRVGAELAEHLESEPFRSIFGRRCAYARDLARLEWAMAEAFFAPDASPLREAALAAVAPGDWPELRFETTPSLALLDLDWPVHRIRERFDREDEAGVWDAPPPLALEPTRLRVWRLDERVRHRVMPPEEAEALAAAAAGEPFAAICERLAASVGEEAAAARAADHLGSWSADGLLVGLRSPDPAA